MNEKDLQLILVLYGSDTGLISLAARTILCHTVETGDGGLEWPKNIPIVDFSDEGKFTQLLGQDPDNPEHNWDDVLRYVLSHAEEIIAGGRLPVCNKELKLFNKGSLITFRPDVCGREHCLGYLVHFKGHGVYEPSLGRVDVAPQEAEAHNAALSRAEVEGLDNNCRIGMRGTFYLVSLDGKSVIRTFVGDVVTGDVVVKGRSVTFRRKGMTFRGRKRDDELLFFRRIA